MFKKAFSDPKIFKSFIDDFFDTDIYSDRKSGNRKIDCRYDLYAKDNVRELF
jgi:hypothetical protein